jgi:hypothetical protein
VTILRRLSWGSPPSVVSTDADHDLVVTLRAFLDFSGDICTNCPPGWDSERMSLTPLWDDDMIEMGCSEKLSPLSTLLAGLWARAAESIDMVTDELASSVAVLVAPGPAGGLGGLRLGSIGGENVRN